MTDSTDNARELAYQAYINEMTPNGNTRIDNLTLCNTGPRAHQHIATQVDLAFQAGWQARADLAPDPLRAVKVKPLVWEYHPAGAIAASPTGFAYIIDTRMKNRVYSLKGFNPPREFSSMDEAKAAAQADYETRIRSALEPDPLADARVRALVEAVNETVRLLWEEMSKQGNVGTHGGYIYMKLRPALAAFDKGDRHD